MSAPKPNLVQLLLAEAAEHVRALQDENARAEENGDYACVFSSDDDARIPDGADCGGCACHLAAPCDHHLGHLPPDDAAELALALARLSAAAAGATAPAGAVCPYPAGSGEARSWLRERPNRCGMCGGPLDDPARPVATGDCGGDCRSCMAGIPDPDAVLVLLSPTVDAAAALVASLDGTMGKTPAEVVADLRSTEYPVSVDPALLAALVEAVCDGGSRPGWHGVERGWWSS